MKVILEMLSYPFLVRALVVGVLVSLCASLLGVSLVLKRYSMIGDGLSHVGFGALAIATALNLAPLAVAVPVALPSSWKWRTEQRTKTASSRATPRSRCSRAAHWPLA